MFSDRTRPAMATTATATAADRIEVEIIVCVCLDEDDEIAGGCDEKERFREIVGGLLSSEQRTRGQRDCLPSEHRSRVWCVPLCLVPGVQRHQEVTKA